VGGLDQGLPDWPAQPGRTRQAQLGVVQLHRYPDRARRRGELTRQVVPVVELAGLDVAAQPHRVPREPLGQRRVGYHTVAGQVRRSAAARRQPGEEGGLDGRGRGDERCPRVAEQGWYRGREQQQGAEPEDGGGGGLDAFGMRDGGRRWGHVPIVNDRRPAEPGRSSHDRLRPVRLGGV
jgi:hypothetical protein